MIGMKITERIQAKNDEIVVVSREIEALLAESDLSDEKLEILEEKSEQLEALKRDIAQLRKYQSIGESAEEARTMAIVPSKSSAISSVSIVASGAAMDMIEQKSLTLADAVIEDTRFKSWLHSVRSNNGQVHEAVPVKSPAVVVKNLITTASPTSAGAFSSPQRIPTIENITLSQPLNLLSLVTRGAMTSDVIEYVVNDVFVNNAAPVAEATALTGTSGLKPSSLLGFRVFSQTVKTIAHLFHVTRKALADEAQLRTYIDNSLRFGLLQELQDQMIAGNGVGENFTGILNTTGVQTLPHTTDLLVSTRMAKTRVQLGGRTQPTAFLMHPTHWERIELLRDADNRYLIGQPQGVLTPTLWGVPVVTDESVPTDRIICADFRFAELWDRMQTTIYVTDSHADHFARNIISLLAEVCAAFLIRRPTAFCVIENIP